MSLSSTFDFRASVAYAAAAKRRFHQRARKQLRLVAGALGLPAHTFDLRSNAGGIAVSGEITLHADHLYVQASQPAFGGDNGVLFRTCDGRKDYCGHRNQFASLDLLNTPDLLARRIREALHV